MGSTGKASKSKRRPDKPWCVLFSCVGRRVSLLQSFREAATVLGISLEVHGADANWLSPAMHLVDKGHILPPISDSRYVEALLDVVESSAIDLLIPLIDPELLPIAAAAERFEVLGCRPLISAEPVVRICRDKMATYRALKAVGIDTPATWTWPTALTRKRHRFPYFLKPRMGSAAIGNYVIHNARELRTLGRLVPDAIVQEFVDGAEHTLDVYTGFDGKPRCVVPRKRIEVRMGEVSKGVIVKDEAIMAVGRRVAEMLGDCRGVITVQCIVTPDRQIRVIEINPRFGGGVPLAIHAGADFPRWILAELTGKKPEIEPASFQDDIAMLRFDEAVFVPEVSKLAD